MLCVRPFKPGLIEFGCGQCMPCRVNKRRSWTGRILLESHLHAHNCFATLTYKENPLSLDPRDLQLFLKRLRSIYPSRLRFFGVGEYGDRFGRPHYHVALFGVSFLDGAYLREAWKEGFVHVGELNRLTAQYIAGYVCKKLTKAGDPRLEGRHPEFSRMSLRPGIGAGAGAALAAAFSGEGPRLALEAAGDVPSQVRVAGKLLPLGSYIRRQARKSLGRVESLPTEVKQRLVREALLMSEEDKALREKKRIAQYETALARNKLAREKKVL